MVNVEIRSPYPLGYGYAGSAVVNIAKYVRLRGLSLEAFQMSHAAEVTAGTDLGDVLALYSGGCLVVRTKPGAPGVGEAVGYPYTPLAAVTVHTKRLETTAMLRDLRMVLEVEGRRAMERAVDGDFYSFLETARRFSIVVSFLSKELEAELVKLRGPWGITPRRGFGGCGGAGPRRRRRSAAKAARPRKDQ